MVLKPIKNATMETETKVNSLMIGLLYYVNERYKKYMTVLLIMIIMIKRKLEDSFNNLHYLAWVRLIE